MGYYKSTVSEPQLGFTLIELLSVLSLTSILLGMWVIPAYQQWLQDSRLETKARQLLLTLQFARTVAIQRHIKVTVCKSNDQQSCGGTWQDGWIVLAHPEGSGLLQVLKIHQGLSPQQSLIWKGARYLEAVEFQPRGISVGHNGRFVLCARGSKIAWFIFVSPTGRVRLEASRDLSYCIPSSL
jgi:type IV fimbrial biogenesis protein FimT